MLINDSSPSLSTTTPHVAQQSRDHTPSDQAPHHDEVPKTIHILGLGSVGKLVAHSLRGLADPPPITLLAHRRALYNAWKKGRKEIVLETDGFQVPATGFNMELALPSMQIHGVEVTDTDLINDNPDGLAPHEAAEQLKKEQEELKAELEQAEPGEESTDPIHNLIITVKAPRTVSALKSVKHRLLPTSSICFLQNGMGIIDEVNKKVFPDLETRPNYVQGIVTHGVNAPKTADPFFAIHAGHGTISLGLLPRTNPADSSYVSDMQSSVLFPPTARYLIRSLTRTPVLAAVGLPPVELLQQQLEKLAQNAVINPLTVILDARNGSILYNYAMTRTMRLLLGEISLVLRSLPELQGLPNVSTRFSPDRLETLVVGIANRTRDNVSSMLADVRNGTTTEIKYINGYVVRRGEEVGVQCVCNYMVMQMVMGKNSMVKRENLDEIPVERPDLTGEK